MKILVCGGRNYQGYKDLEEVLNSIHKERVIGCVVHGNAKGADSLAELWCMSNQIPSLPYPAQWGKHGKGAGPIRNEQMLNENPDIALVVCFPGSIGTRHMRRLALSRDIEVLDC